MSEREFEERSFLKNLASSGFQLGTYYGTTRMMLLFDRGINTKIFCDIKDAAYMCHILLCVIFI